MGSEEEEGEEEEEEESAFRGGSGGSSGKRRGCESVLRGATREIECTHDGVVRLTSFGVTAEVVSHHTSSTTSMCQHEAQKCWQMHQVARAVLVPPLQHSAPHLDVPQNHQQCCLTPTWIAPQHLRSVKTAAAQTMKSCLPAPHFVLGSMFLTEFS